MGKTLRSSNQARQMKLGLTLIAGALLIAVFVPSAVAGKPGGGVVVTRRYSFEIIAPLGSNEMYARGMNEHGDVVGNSRPATGGDRAFISVAGTDGSRVTWDLNTLLHPDDAAQWVLRSAKGINDAGQICGGGQHSGQQFNTFRLTPNGYTDENGQIWPSIEGVPLSDVERINNHGDVVGQLNSVPAVYTANGQLVVFGLLQAGDNFGLGLDINDFGQAVGFSRLNPSDYSRAFRFDAGIGMTDLGNLKGSSATAKVFAQALNGSGDVVGNSSAGNKQHAFLYRDGQPLKDLGELGGGFSEARDISETGEIIGVARLSNGAMHPFLYTEQYKLVDLEPLIVNLPDVYRNLLGRNAWNGWTNTMQMNESGQICGIAGDPDTVPFQAYVLTKIAE